MKTATLTFLALVTQVVSGPASVVINEIRVDQAWADTDEYIEFIVPTVPFSFANHFLVSIGDAPGGPGAGEVEGAFDLSVVTATYEIVTLTEDTFDISNFSVTGSPGPIINLGVGNPLNFENADNITIMLVTDFVGAVGDDLDTDNDGVLDSTPWSAVVDAISLVETPDEGDKFYAGSLGFTDLGPIGTFVPGHVYRDGTTGDWAIGSFALGADDTPGTVNGSIPEPSAPLLLAVGALLGFRRRR